MKASYSFPVGYDSATCYLVPINAALVPLVAGALALFQERHYWSTSDDYERGYNAFAELKACLMRACIDDLVESNNRLYRMLDTAIYGRTYVVQTADPLVVVPDIEPTHVLEIEHSDSVLGRMEDLRQLLQNALNGTETPNYDRPNGVRDLLESLITALQANGQLDDEMLAKLTEIALLVA